MDTLYSEDDVELALYALHTRKEAWARGLTPEAVAMDVSCYDKSAQVDEEETRDVRRNELAAYVRGAALLEEARLVFSQRFAWGEMIPRSGKEELGAVDSPVLILGYHCVDGRKAEQFVALRSLKRDSETLSEWLSSTC